MIKGNSNDSQDPHVMEVASSLVNDVIEKAREEVLKRKSVSQSAETESTPFRRLSQWQHRAQGAFRRFLTSLCVRIQEITK